MEWEEFKKGFELIGVSFNAQDKGARYTDDSAAAINQHHDVDFGIIGYQKWEGQKDPITTENEKKEKGGF